jgi:lipopolysaccharide biosynthesis glycosyltransferase
VNIRVRTPHEAPDGTRMNVLFCANPPYFQHMAVTAVSLAENNPSSVIDIHLITCDRDADAEGRLARTIARYANLPLTTHHVDGRKLERYFVDGFMTKECYLRMLAPDVLPPEIGRVLYLDCDLVVLDDLRPLWNVDLGDKPVAAAPDYPRVPSLVAPERLAAIGMPQDAPYLNSGVLVIDLNRWRQRRLTDRLFAYIQEKASALSAYDQDAVNVVLLGDIHILDCRWNVQARMYRSGRRAFPLEFEATRAARRDPAIIHYTGSEKPWLFRSGAALRAHYFQYLEKTAWRDRELGALSRAQKLEHRLDGQMLGLGIDYLHIIAKLRWAPGKLRDLAVARLPRLVGTMVGGRV